ncbi:hypothetical protein HNY73_016345 [Argiope bruennichi]|uniref:Uncharacterized protein n=1 Tax=Argiope bruennichi TaxID=94029 RepID=A0A8T0EJL3_ARGBR|nr:hypothetical protein HNY73_016345 [Argiope bruennichi]
MRAFDASYMAGGMDAYALRDNGSTPSSPADYEDIEGEDQADTSSNRSSKARAWSERNGEGFTQKICPTSNRYSGPHKKYRCLTFFSYFCGTPLKDKCGIPNKWQTYVTLRYVTSNREAYIRNCRCTFESAWEEHSN